MSEFMGLIHGKYEAKVWETIFILLTSGVCVFKLEIINYLYQQFHVCHCAISALYL